MNLYILQTLLEIYYKEFHAFQGLRLKDDKLFSFNTGCHALGLLLTNKFVEQLGDELRVTTKGNDYLRKMLEIEEKL